MLKNCMENALTLCFNFFFFFCQKVGIPLHLCDLSLSVSNGCRRLGYEEPPCFQGINSLWNSCSHTIDLLCTPRFWPLLLKLKLPRETLTSIVLGNHNKEG